MLFLVLAAIVSLVHSSCCLSHVYRFLETKLPEVIILWKKKSIYFSTLTENTKDELCDFIETPPLVEMLSQACQLLSSECFVLKIQPTCVVVLFLFVFFNGECTDMASCKPYM